MKHRISVFLVLLLLAHIVSADGGGWSYSYSTDSFSPLLQTKQVCSIDYKNGREDMLISVKTKLKGDKVVWIFPVPSKPENTEIDVVKEFPSYSGYEVRSKAGYTVHNANFPMLMSQVYLLSPGIIFWQMGVFGGGGATEGFGQDSGVTIHEQLEKMGLITELVTAEDEEGFNKYIQDKGLTLPEESLSTIREYIGEEYSFVISWVSDVEEYKKEVRGDVLAVKIKFPTNRIYYPLKLTSIYGEQRVPMTIYVNGYVNPALYENIMEGSRVRYYANDRGFRYTKININTKSNSFTEDLWISKMPPVNILIADFIAPNPIISMIILFAIYSCLASIISGLIVFKGEVPVHKLALLGLANFLTLIGFAIAAILLIKKGGGDKGFIKKLLIVLAAALLFPLLLIPLTIFIPILVFLSFVVFVFVYPLIFLAIAIWALRKIREKVTYIALFSILFLVITISANWILVAAFPPEIHGWRMNIATGFSKIKPLNPGEIQVTISDVSAVFINVAGGMITLTNASIDFKTPAGVDCSEATVIAQLPEGEVIDLSVGRLNVGQGEVFNLYVTGCDGLTSGDRYYAQLSIVYDIEIGGFRRTRTENGTIGGYVY